MRVTRMLIVAAAVIALSSTPGGRPVWKVTSMAVDVWAAEDKAPDDASLAALPARPLTLDECVRIAVEENPAVRAAHEESVGATENVGSARVPYWPEVGVSAGYSRWQRHIFLPDGLGQPGAPLPSEVGPTNDFTFSLNAGYLVWDGGERKARLGAATAKRKAAEAGEEMTRQDLIVAVQQAFFAYGSSLDVLGVARGSLARAEDHVRIAEARKSVGAVPLADVLRAEVDSSNARLAMTRAEGAVRVTRGQLATTMGLPANTPIEIVVPSDTPTPPDDRELASAMETAVSGRPVVKAAEQEIEAAKLGVDAARGATAPKVRAMASYGREDADWWSKDNTWSAGVVVSVPIFTGFSRQHDVGRARASLARSEAGLDRAKLDVRQQVWNAHSAVKDAHEAVQASNTLVQSAGESLRLARERYQVGAGTITDLLDAENALARAQASLVGARYDLQAAWARYRWSTGGALLDR